MVVKKNIPQAKAPAWAAPLGRKESHGRGEVGHLKDVVCLMLRVDGHLHGLGPHVGKPM